MDIGGNFGELTGYLIGLQVKKVEDVVYDLSLRGLVPKGSAAA